MTGDRFVAPVKKHAQCMKPEKVGTVLLLVPWPVQRFSSASNEVMFRDTTPDSNFDMINISQLSNVLEMPGAGELACNCVGNSTSEHLLLASLCGQGHRYGIVGSNGTGHTLCLWT